MQENCLDVVVGGGGRLADVAEVVAAGAGVPGVLLGLHAPGQAVLLVRDVRRLAPPKTCHR